MQGDDASTSVNTALVLGISSILFVPALFTFLIYIRIYLLSIPAAVFGSLRTFK